MREAILAYLYAATATAIESAKWHARSASRDEALEADSRAQAAWTQRLIDAEDMAAEAGARAKLAEAQRREMWIRFACAGLMGGRRASLAAEDADRLLGGVLRRGREGAFEAQS